MKKPHEITDATREKMRQAALNRSPEAEARRIEAMNSPEIRAKKSEAMRRRHEAGEFTESFAATQEKAWAANRKETLTYSGIHAWVKRNWGRADRCEMCGKENLTGRAVHWANLDHQYSRNREDWKMLCRPCHARHDQENLGVSFTNDRKKATDEERQAISEGVRAWWAKRKQQ